MLHVPFQVVSCQLTLYLKFHSSSHHQKNPLQTFSCFLLKKTHKKKIKCPIQLLVLQLRMCQFLTGITVVEWVKCHILPCRYVNGKPGRILHCSLKGGESGVNVYTYIYIRCAVTEESTSKQRLFILCGCLYVKYASTYQRSDYRNQRRLITAAGITPCGVYCWNIRGLVLTLIQMSVTAILSCYSQTYLSHMLHRTG